MYIHLNIDRWIKSIFQISNTFNYKPVQLIFILYLLISCLDKLYCLKKKLFLLLLLKKNYNSYFLVHGFKKIARLVLAMQVATCQSSSLILLTNFDGNLIKLRLLNISICQYFYNNTHDQTSSSRVYFPTTTYSFLTKLQQLFLLKCYY